MKTIRLRREDLLQQVHRDLLVKSITKRTGCEAAYVGNILSILGVNFESHKAALESKHGVDVNIVKAWLTAMESMVDHYTIEREAIMEVRDEVTPQAALEAAAEEMEEDLESEGDIGDVVVDIINSIAERNTKMTNDTIRDVSKMILTLEKEQQKSIKDSLEEETSDEEEIKDDDEDEDDDTKKKKDSEGEDDANADGSSENPFEDSDKGGEKSEDSGNPFDDPTHDDDDASGDDVDAKKDSKEKEDSDDSENPFDDKSKKEDGEEGNPFEDKGEESFVPVKEHASIILESIGGVGAVCHFATSVTQRIFYQDMEEAYQTFGAESEQYLALESRFRSSSKGIVEALTAILTMESIYQYPIQRDRIQYPEFCLPEM